VVRARRFFDQYRWVEALERFPLCYREERRLLRYLLKAGENYSKARKKLSRDVLKLYFTAYQSYLFNRSLEKRLQRFGADLGRVQVGDVAVLHRNGACFHVLDQDGLDERVEAFEISPSGPIFGKKMLLPGGPQAEIEDEVLEEEGLRHRDFHQLGPGLHLEGGRRSLRVKVEDLTWRLEDRDLHLEFFLGKGVYATTFLRELMKNEETLPGFLDSGSG
jgi:tRNA pseudouridine13 synthase